MLSCQFGRQKKCYRMSLCMHCRGSEPVGGKIKGITLKLVKK